MDVHTWIAADVESVRSKFNGSVLTVVPRQRWVEQVDNGGSSIAHLALHMARHHDLAVTTVIRDHEPLFFAHRAALGLADAPTWAGLSEREDPALTGALPLDAVSQYMDDVFDHTMSWLDSVGTMMLDTVPDTARRLTERAALTDDEVGWLYNMWAGKPVSWLLQWPVIGHGHSHVGEATSVRNRMGLSPF